MRRIACAEIGGNYERSRGHCRGRVHLTYLRYIASGQIIPGVSEPRL